MTRNIKTCFWAVVSLLPPCTTAFTFNLANPPRNQINKSNVPSTNTASQSFAFARFEANPIERHESAIYAKKGGKKNRRRRKDGGLGKKQSTQDEAVQDVGSPMSGEYSNLDDPLLQNNLSQTSEELPDFDLVEDYETAEAAPSYSSTSISIPDIPTPSSTITPIDENDSALMEEMKFKGTEDISLSTNDLLRTRNRDLEKKFVVNDVTQEFPNFAEYTKEKATLGQGKVGKKAARAAMRREAAIQAEKENSDDGILSKLPKLPFISDDGDEELTFVKVLEKGAWSGIFALVTWEFYINSPLFSRVAPLAPVVFRDPTTMT